MQLFFVTFSQVVLAIALPYFLFSLVLGIRVAQKRGGSLRAQEELDSSVDVDLTTPSGYHVYFLIACLNEAMVIGSTVRRLLADPACSVVVIDDGSDDGTGDRALEAAAALRAHDRLIVLERRLPNARQGKGRALNAAYTLVLNDVQFRGLDPARVIVCVMDADGMLSRGGTRVPLKYFDEERVGGVQLIVRIRNRDRLIGQFQDVEFWMISALSQFARSLSGTVSLGGNGQFTRLSALLTLDGDPWSDSLTEDLDLGLQLLAKGWKCTTTTHAFVDQQGVESYRRLLKQRTRWYQGHMTCITRLPQLWRSEQIGQIALGETTMYLLVPWLIVLPWSVLQQWVFLELLLGDANGVFARDLGSISARLVYGLIFYVFSFMPNLAIGLTYARRTKSVSIGRALALGHLMILWNYIGYLAAWRGIYRMIRRRSGWDKTDRSLEVHEGEDRVVVGEVGVGDLVMVSEGVNELSFITPGVRTAAALPVTATEIGRSVHDPAAMASTRKALDAVPVNSSVSLTSSASARTGSPSAPLSAPAGTSIVGGKGREPTPPRLLPAVQVTSSSSAGEPTPPRAALVVSATAGVRTGEPTPPRAHPVVKPAAGVSGKESTPLPAAPVAAPALAPPGGGFGLSPPGGASPRLDASERSSQRLAENPLPSDRGAPALPVENRGPTEELLSSPPEPTTSRPPTLRSHPPAIEHEAKALFAKGDTPMAEASTASTPTIAGPTLSPWEGSSPAGWPLAQKSPPPSGASAAVRHETDVTNSRERAPMGAEQGERAMSQWNEEFPERQIASPGAGANGNGHFGPGRPAASAVVDPPSWDVEPRRPSQEKERIDRISAELQLAQEQFDRLTGTLDHGARVDPPPPPAPAAPPPPPAVAVAPPPAPAAPPPPPAVAVAPPPAPAAPPPPPAVAVAPPPAPAAPPPPPAVAVAPPPAPAAPPPPPAVAVAPPPAPAAPPPPPAVAVAPPPAPAAPPPPPAVAVAPPPAPAAPPPPPAVAVAPPPQVALERPSVSMPNVESRAEAPIVNGRAALGHIVDEFPARPSERSGAFDSAVSVTAGGDRTADGAESPIVDRPPMLPVDAQEAIERSEAEAEQAKRIAVELRHQLYATNLAYEKAAYVNAGVPAELVEIASPLLYGEEHVVELSPTVTIDAGDTVRRMLDCVRDVAKAPAKRVSVVDIEGASELLERWEREQLRRND